MVSGKNFLRKVFLGLRLGLGLFGPFVLETHASNLPNTQQDSLPKHRIAKKQVRIPNLDSLGSAPATMSRDSGSKDSMPQIGHIPGLHRHLEISGNWKPEAGIKNPDSMNVQALHPFSEYYEKEWNAKTQDRFFYSPMAIKAYAEYNQVNGNHAPVKAAHGKVRVVRSSWILVLIFFLVTLLTLIKVQNPTELRTLNDSLFNDRLIRDDRELRFLRSPSSLLTLVAFCLSFALLVFFYCRDEGIRFESEGLPLYFIMSTLVILFFVTKIGVLWLIGQILKAGKAIQSYLTLNYIVMANFTLIMCPFLFVYALNKDFLLHYFSVWIPFLILLFFLFLYIRSIIFIVSNYRFSNFYLFLYFCAVEICPMLLVFKVIYA